ncbi:MAG: DNA polymerase III subunit delta [Planctomycetaceae bacterium]|nr:DNA polymerase III subunit delta [Planctomycetaceae bacterium]
MTAAAAKPVYVLHGDDAHLRDEARAGILDAVLGGADPQTCVTTFDVEAELADVLDELRTLPFLSPHRVVIVRDADAFITANRAALEAYVKAPSVTATLVLTVLSWNRSTNLAKIVAKVGQVFDCASPAAGNLGRWLSEQAAKRDKTIEPQACALLTAWIGVDLGSLTNEMEKLALYVGERKKITVDDVSAIVTATAGPATFALTNALTAGEVKGALTALAGMLTVRGEEFRTLGMIGWHLRKVLKAHQLLAAGQSLEGELRMPYEQRQAFMALLKRRPLTKVQADFRRLISTDIAMKSGTEAAAAMQDLVVALCM